jgi:DNA-binding SARP family transcriptional activator
MVGQGGVAHPGSDGPPPGTGSGLWCRTLGAFEVHLDGRPVELGQPKQRAVLAVLVLEAGRAVSTDRLVTMLWGDDPSPKAVGSLQVYVSALRRVLEPGRQARQAPEVLVTEAPGYRLVVDRQRVDHLRFEDLVARARSRSAEGDTEGTDAAVDEALALWRGPLLPELGDEPFVVQAATRLGRLRAGALGLGARARLERGDHLGALDLLEATIGEYPMDEHLHGLLALASYRAGRQADALRVLDRVRRALADNAGLEPGPELRSLEADLLAHAPSLAWRSTPPPGTGGPAAVEPAADRPPPVTPPAPRPTGDADALVGRDAELGGLVARLGAVAEGRGGAAVLVVGEPGIGKTRLVEELASRAGEAGVATAWARCPESGAMPPFWPATQLGDQLLHAGVISRPFLAAGEAAAPEGTTLFSLYRQVVDVLRSASRPALLVVDDLQWVDADSLRLLAHLAGELSSLPALIVATARPLDADTSPVVLDTLDAIVRTPGSLQLQLAPLTPEAVTEWLRRRPRTVVPDEVAKLLHERTGGHPLFVKELTELLAAEGRLDDPVAAAAARTIPAGVQFVVRRRISRLPAPTQRLCSVAAVVGRSFDLDVVAAVSEQPLDDALDALDPALVAGLVIDDPGGGFRFSHALVADALAAEVNHARRARLHAGAARVLSGHSDADPAVVAHHALQGALAGTAELAVEASTAAARSAAARLGFEEAAEHWARAVSALERARPQDRAARIGVLCELAAARFRVDQVDDAADAAVEAMELAEATGDERAMAGAAVLLGNPHVWPNRSYGTVDARTVSGLRRTAELVGRRDPATRALVLGALAFELTYAERHQWDEARAEAVAAARACGDNGVLGRVLMNVMGPLRPTQLAERFATAREVLELAAGGKVPGDVEMTARFNLALAHAEAAELDAARAEWTRCRDQAERIGGSGVRAQLNWFGAALEVARAHYDEAGDLARTAADIYRRTRRYDAELMALALDTTVTADRGGFDALVGRVVAARAASPRYSRLANEFASWVLVEHGWHEQAAASVAGADDTAPIADDYTMLGTAAMAIHVRAELGDVDGVSRVMPQLEPFSGRWASTGSGGCVAGLVDLALARGAALTGRPTDARRWFQVAVEGHERLRAPVWLARSLLHQGRFLLGGGPDDIARGREAIDRAAGLAEAHGAVNVARQAHEARSA